MLRVLESAKVTVADRTAEETPMKVTAVAAV